MNNYLITGATGFLGQYVIEALIKQGTDPQDIIAVGRHRERLTQLYKTYKIQIEKVDLANAKNVRELYETHPKITHIIHLAGLSSAWGSFESFKMANHQSTVNLIEQAICLPRFKQFLFTSTPSVYAQFADQDFIKESDGIQETSLNDYIATKKEAERFLEEQTDLHWTIFRPRALIGKGDPIIVPHLLETNQSVGLPLRNGGKHLIDVTCVENVAHALMLAIDHPNSYQEIYNVTDGKPRRFIDLLEVIFAGLNIKLRPNLLPFDGLMALSYGVEKFAKILKIKKEPKLLPYKLSTVGYAQTLDISKIKEQLSYKPIVTLEEKLDDYLTYYQQFIKGH